MEAEKKIIRVGHSPDPDDAFMFYAIKQNKIDLEGYQIEDVVEDIESLNQRALLGELEVSAISLHCYAYVSKRYMIMPCGISMGDGYGPIVVAKEGVKIEDLKGQKVAAPGFLTTAALVAQLAMPDVELVHMPFDRIIQAVKSGEVPAGILIHEGQLTYDKEGLIKIIDFGEWWKKERNLPLPLGIDVIRRDLPNSVIMSTQKILKSSIEYGLKEREEALGYALGFGRGISKGMADRFVGMYVNPYTVDLGDKGRKAVEILLQEAFDAGIIPEMPRVVFSDTVV